MISARSQFHPKTKALLCPSSGIYIIMMSLVNITTNQGEGLQASDWAISIEGTSNWEKTLDLLDGTNIQSVLRMPWEEPP